MAGRQGTRPPKGWQSKFLQALRMIPEVYRACRIARTTPPTAYALRNKDEEFAKKWDLALETGFAKLEERSLKLATEGQKRGVWKTKDGKPYRVETITEYSEPMLLHWMRTHYPHHREQATIAHVGGGEGTAPIQTQVVPPLLAKDLEDVG